MQIKNIYNISCDCESEIAIINRDDMKQFKKFFASAERKYRNFCKQNTIMVYTLGESELKGEYLSDHDQQLSESMRKLANSINLLKDLLLVPSLELTLNLNNITQHAIYEFLVAFDEFELLSEQEN